MIEQAGPPSKQVQAAKQVQELIKDGDDAVIIGVFSSEQDAAYEIYIEACEYQVRAAVRVEPTPVNVGGFPFVWQVTH